MFDKIIGPEAQLTWPVQFWPIIPVAFIVSVAATWLAEKIAPRLGVVDKPDNSVKTHRHPTPYLGGVAMFVGILAGMLVSFLFIPEIYAGSIAFRWGLGILAASAVAVIVGCLDDIFDIRPGQKVLGQTAAALILVAVGVTPELSGIVGGLSKTTEIIAQAVIVILFVLGATNSLNLLDGLDGLCAGVTAIMTVAFLLLATLMGTWYAHPTDAVAVKVILCLALLPSVLGFLIFNYHPARIFMGDAGSLLLGVNMAVLMIMFSEGGLQWWAASVVIFGLPILDTTVAFARRIINKRPLFVPDRGHIYDQMMDRGLSIRKTVALCCGLTAMYAVVGLVVVLLSIFAAVVVCAVTVLVSAFAVWKKGYLKMTGLRGTTPPNQVTRDPWFERRGTSDE